MDCCHQRWCSCEWILCILSAVHCGTRLRDDLVFTGTLTLEKGAKSVHSEKEGVKNEFAVLKLDPAPTQREAVWLVTSWSAPRLVCLRVCCELWLLQKGGERLSADADSLKAELSIHESCSCVCVCVCVCSFRHLILSPLAYVMDTRKWISWKRMKEKCRNIVSTRGENITSEDGVLLFCTPGRSVVMFWAGRQKFFHFICLSQSKLIQNLRTVVTTTTRRAAHTSAYRVVVCQNNRSIFQRPPYERWAVMTLSSLAKMDTALEVQWFWFIQSRLAAEMFHPLWNMINVMFLRVSERCFFKAKCKWCIL